MQIKGVQGLGSTLKGAIQFRNLRLGFGSGSDFGEPGSMMHDIDDTSGGVPKPECVSKSKVTEQKEKQNINSK